MSEHTRCEDCDREDAHYGDDCIATLRARLTAAEGLLREAEDQLSDWWNCMGDGTGKGPFPGLLGDTATLVPKLRAHLAAPPGRREAARDDRFDPAPRCTSCPHPAHSKPCDWLVVAGNSSTCGCAAPIPQPAPAPEVCRASSRVPDPLPPRPVSESCPDCRDTGLRGFGVPGIGPCPTCRPATPGDGRERP